LNWYGEFAADFENRRCRKQKMPARIGKMSRRFYQQSNTTRQGGGFFKTALKTPHEDAPTLTGGVWLRIPDRLLTLPCGTTLVLEYSPLS
jgi:hypothetical protein